ncbi:hypothetical protein EVG20_g9373 [Dentipellis fragilis]|uniref:Uncharacterized protein n=1 Tax=Dentipellis fragilis TaxID=205917 RepID=A0A4Y9Y0P2_9AGAM|nr:hypothetical protein EVG20_g9373 [Dentipellis fragilis]
MPNFMEDAVPDALLATKYKSISLAILPSTSVKVDVAHLGRIKNESQRHSTQFASNGQDLGNGHGEMRGMCNITTVVLPSAKMAKLMQEANDCDEAWLECMAFVLARGPMQSSGKPMDNYGGTVPKLELMLIDICVGIFEPELRLTSRHLDRQASSHAPPMLTYISILRGHVRPKSPHRAELEGSIMHTEALQLVCQEARARGKAIPSVLALQRGHLLWQGVVHKIDRHAHHTALFRSAAISALDLGNTPTNADNYVLSIDLKEKPDATALPVKDRYTVIGSSVLLLDMAEVILSQMLACNGDGAKLLDENRAIHEFMKNKGGLGIITLLLKMGEMCDIAGIALPTSRVVQEIQRLNGWGDEWVHMLRVQNHAGLHEIADDPTADDPKALSVACVNYEMLASARLYDSFQAVF